MVEDYWKQVKEVFTSRCEEVIERKDNRHKEWINRASLDKIANRRTKNEMMNNNKTRENY